jgi:hypothetical protein
MPTVLSPEDFFLSLELDFSKGDSSIYDTDRLRNNSAFQKYGLGSIIQLFNKPIAFKQPNVPSVEGTLLVETTIVDYLVKTSIVSVSLYIIKDNNLWVIIPASSILNGQPISKSEALKKYKSNGKHFGKFALEKNAQKYKTELESNFAKNLERKSLSEVSQFGPYVTSLELSYSIDGANQIQFTVIDKDYLMMEKNLFMARRKLLYRGNMYEIGVVEVGQGPAGSPQVTVTAWDAAVQAMKRDKKPDSISGSSAYEYAVNAAKKFGIDLIAEKSNKTQTINKGNGTNSDQSVWSVLSSAANQDEFVLYVMDGVMVYGSQKWLMWKFGTDSKSIISTQLKSAKGIIVKGNIDLNSRPTVKNNNGSISTVLSISIGEGKLTVLIPTVIKKQDGKGVIVSDKDAINYYKKTGQHLGKFSNAKDATAYAVALSAQQDKLYNSNKPPSLKRYSRLYYNPAGTIPADAQKFTVIEYPTVRQSENDPLEGDGRIRVAKPNGCVIRPGMTVIIGPKPTLFQGGYIVTEVLFSEGTNDPVEISFRTPEKPVNQEDKP